ncbi:MAG: hypothetical protein KAI25_12585, partial [Hyphomicrobiaceae bacterium]|nr:hypothetical protein [Hyphomicrobiaceae bacterium]
MTTGAQFTAGTDLDLAADSLLSPLVYADSPSNNFSAGTSGDTATYLLDIPKDAVWYLWARMYYGDASSNGANSFWVLLDGGAANKLGNNKGFQQTWHWDGDGAIETGPTAPLSLGFLTSGVHTLVIEKREVVNTPPRLDLLFITDDPGQVPTDADASAALGICPNDAACDDGNTCTTNLCNGGICETTDTIGPCDDGIACTLGDICIAGTCIGGDACPIGLSCNLETGTCELTATTTLPATTTTLIATTTLAPATTTTLGTTT